MRSSSTLVVHPNLMVQGQDEVFNEARGLVESVVEGYNVCMLFFGPTGTGKTYTMLGRPGDLGMAANALNHLFR